MTKAGIVAVIDDDEGVRNSLLFLLESCGYNAVGFASAVDFLNCDARAVQCLILDQHMPKMTGLELTAKLRAEGTSIPI